jgi:citrate lyase beta subunit
MQYGLAGARSMVFCTEDAVNLDEVDAALANLSRGLHQLIPTPSFRRFVRPRNAEVLAAIIRMPGIEKIDGFVLPKADTDTLPTYRKALRNGDNSFVAMPTLETIQVLDPAALPHIRSELNRLATPTLCLRIGGNDLMSLLGLKRLPGMTAYDTPLRTVIDQLVLAFRPHGFEMSAPVFDFIDDHATLVNEVIRDISYGFYAKTAIHPNQLPTIEQQYARYTENHLEQARALLGDNARAVFALDGQMMERACHANWATRTMALADCLTNAAQKPALTARTNCGFRPFGRLELADSGMAGVEH